MEKKVTFKRWIIDYRKVDAAIGDLARDVEQDERPIDGLDDLLHRTRDRVVQRVMLDVWTFYLLDTSETYAQAIDVLDDIRDYYDA